MPSRPLRGRPQGCQADACNAAALRALGVLHELGILARCAVRRCRGAHGAGMEQRCGVHCQQVSSGSSSSTINIWD